MMVKMPYCFALLISLVVAVPLRAQPAQPTDDPMHARLVAGIDAALDDPAFDNAWWGALVIDLVSGDTLYARNARRSFIPASNTKLYTTAAALDQLGPGYHYTTTLYIDGPVEDGVLKGNLVVRGSGDPTLGSAYLNLDDIAHDPTAVFRAWADSLKALGVRRVTGDVIGDDDVFDDEAFGREWSIDDLPYYYSAEIGGLPFNDNTVHFEITARGAGEPASVRWSPPTDYVEVVNLTRTVTADSSLDEGYRRDLGTNHFVLSSRVPAGRTDPEDLTISNPTLFAAHVLRETMLDAGIPIEGRPMDVDDLAIRPAYNNGRMRRAASYTSPPLSDLIVPLNKESLNHYAEQVLRTLGVERPAPDPDLPRGSARMGVAAAQRTYAAAGVDTSRINLVDGSGLSRHNLVTPAMTTALLRYMWAHPDPDVAAAFQNSLPVGGVDGTLDGRYGGGQARGNVRAKTGTLSMASALGGYVTTFGKTPLAFSLMCNHYVTQTRPVRQAQDQIVELLARYSK